jgi:hypothetical protein
MAVKAERSVEPPAILSYALSEEWIARIGRLQDALAVCPADILARCELQRCWRNWNNRKRPCSTGTRSWPAIPTV